MIILPLGILFCIPFVRASSSNFNGTGISMLNVSDCPSCSNTRTLSNIIWSCFATLFACTWTAIHPNIPGMDEGKLVITSRRLFIMGMALIAPELIITWAAQQFLSARQVAKERLRRGASPGAPQPAGNNFKEWTVTHGFFACMGGFLLYFNDKPRATLTPDELLRFVDEGYVDMPPITEADIEDRSRGDMLSKAIALLQLGWFVTQLAARYVQDLPISLLETDTLAVATLTCIAYGWWWKKPKDVAHPIPVHWKATASSSSPSDLYYGVADPRLASGAYLGYFLHPFYSLMGWVIVSPNAVHSRRAPSLGGYIRTRDRAIIILLIGCFSGMVFAGIHFMGWNFQFHTQSERIAWRTASLAILCSSVSISISTGYEILQRHWKRLPSLHHFLDVIMIVSYFTYIAARLTLVVLVLLSFRSLPPGVYDTVAWTKFIPHF